MLTYCDVKSFGKAHYVLQWINIVLHTHSTVRSVDHYDPSIRCVNTSQHSSYIHPTAGSRLTWRTQLAPMNGNTMIIIRILQS